MESLEEMQVKDDIIEDKLKKIDFMEEQMKKQDNTIQDLKQEVDMIFNHIIHPDGNMNNIHVDAIYSKTNKVYQIITK